MVDKVPVDSLLDGWIRALRSQDPGLVKVAVEKFLKDGRSLPNLLTELESLHLRWSDQPTLTGPLGQLLGMARAGNAPVSPLPKELREADVVAEVMLDQLPPSDDRKCGAAYVLGDGRMYVRIHQRFFQLATEGQNSAGWTLPRNAYLNWTFLGLGVRDEMLFGLSWGNFTLFALRPGQPDLLRFSPAISDDDGPGFVLGSDGRRYGWRRTAYKMSHYEDDPGHQETFAYIADPETLKISAINPDSYPSMRNLPGARMSTYSQKCPEIAFAHQSDGAYRVCRELGLAIPSCPEGVPVRSFGRGDSELALYVEIFPSKLCRVYLWEAPEAEVPADLWGPVDEV